MPYINETSYYLPEGSIYTTSPAPVTFVGTTTTTNIFNTPIYTQTSWIRVGQSLQVTTERMVELARQLNAASVSASDFRINVDGWLYQDTSYGDPQHEKKKARATRKARALLKQFLTKEQWAEYTKDKRFHVLSQKGHLYQLRHGRSRNIKLIVDGEIAATYCIHPNGAIPDEDTLLAQKFLLEANEDHFLKTANAEWHTLPIAEAA